MLSRIFRLFTPGIRKNLPIHPTYHLCDSHSKWQFRLEIESFEILGIQANHKSVRIIPFNVNSDCENASKGQFLPKSEAPSFNKTSAFKSFKYALSFERPESVVISSWNVVIPSILRNYFGPVPIFLEWKNSMRPTRVVTRASKSMTWVKHVSQRTE